MMTDRSFSMEAEWGSRVETPERLAKRYLCTVDALCALNPLVDDWDWGDCQEFLESEAESGTYPLATVRPRMAKAIARNMGSIENEEPDPYYGYCLASVIDAGAPGGAMSLGGSVGAKPGSGSWATAWTNRISFEVGPEPDPSLTTFAFWRAGVLLVAETWEASWAEVAPGDIRSIRDTARGACRCAWMSYLSPCLAPLITPPPGIIIECRPNGGLFMAATDNTFCTADPQHLGAARAIEAALQPMNSLAYPIDHPYR